MDWDGKIQAATLACSVSGRRLAPGEDFWSGLVAAPDGSFARRDFSCAAWDDVDRSPFLSWWRQRVPSHAPGRQRLRLDATVLRRLLEDLRGIPRRPEQCLCYVIALCLVRARAFTLHAQPRGEDADLVLEDKRDHSRWIIRDPLMDEQDIARVQRVLDDIIRIGPAEDAGSAIDADPA